MENNVTYLISNYLPIEIIICKCMSLHLVNASEVLHHTSLCNFYVYSRSIVLFITNKKLIITKMVPA